MVTHMAPSRLKVHRLHTRPGLPTTIEHPPKRRCACGTVLTWNMGEMCCACEDKLESNTSITGGRKVKVPPENYGHIMCLRDLGWTYRQIAELFGITPNYACELITKLRRAMT